MVHATIKVAWLLFAVACPLLCCQVSGGTLVTTNSLWRFRKGTNEVSTPLEAWRARGFDDRTWTNAQAPFHFGEAGLAGGTLLADMIRNYSCIFLRRTFLLTNVQELSALLVRAASDDGFVAWVNGTEVARYRVNPGAVAYTNLANSSAPEPVQFIDHLATNLQSLVVGTNVLTVQAFNRAIDNGDFQINVGLESVLRDDRPPTLAGVSPQAGLTADLARITVVFSEAVSGVDEADLLANGQPARSVSGGGDTYTFAFSQPPYGRVRMTWDEGHSIQDLAIPPNGFDAWAPGASWEYEFVDRSPPAMAWRHPRPGASVRQLSQVEVMFNETVAGLRAADLLVNGQPATQLAGLGAGPYVFRFAAITLGPVQLNWDPQHHIQDLAVPPNVFPGGSWAYSVDPELAPPNVLINEFAAGNLNGPTDEDGEAQDWIELLNRGATPVDLAGWALTDDPAVTDKWVFPAVTLDSGQYLLVFASGKDRRPPGTGQRLHTNFKLAIAGEYLGLFNGESPRTPADELRPQYPDQRNNYSYGRVAGNQWRYFSAPTPGRTNGTSTVTGVVGPVLFSVTRGLFEAPFSLRLTNALLAATIRYTTDGSEPTEANGLVYSNGLTISQTTILRAAAFRTNCLPSRIATHTYLFPEQVLRQPANPPGFPTNWGSFRITTGDYGMDRRVVDDPAYTNMVREGLRSLPTLSLVMSVENWFSPTQGIYSNGNSEGLAWERAGSAELICPGQAEEFQINCGLRVQGGTSTGPWKSYKLSLRTSFRGDYGPGWLEHPLFKDSPVRRFNTLVLDAGLNYVWHYGGGAAAEDQRRRAKYVQDQFVSDLQSATGTPAVHGRWMHVYLNGLYWGIYNVHEEPEASFGAEYYGGDKEEYDVLKHTGDNVLDGNGAAWNSMMSLAREGLSDPACYEALQASLDVPSLIDYMLVHLYAGNTDWPQHNWYAFRRRVPGAKFRFVSWDSEHVLKSLAEDRTSANAANSPAELYTLLRANAEFRLLFADRAHRLLFNGGPLYVDAAHPAWDPGHPERNRPAALFEERMAEIDLALACESARWGDNQRSAQPYTRNNEWLTEMNWLRTQYFPQRSAILLSQLRAVGLYPAVQAPVFSQPGGYVAPGHSLAMSAAAGAVYYTMDGSDPRSPLVATVAPRAVRYTNGVPVPLLRSCVVKARAWTGANWSALNEATFQVAERGVPLCVTELMYNPPGGDAYEFVELMNTGALPLDLSLHTLAGIQYLFPPGAVIHAGQVIVLAPDLDPAAFQARYPSVNVAGFYQGTLANRGEELTLKTPDGHKSWRMAYDDGRGWPGTADGQGHSLELIDLDGSPSDPANWRASDAVGGSPGVWQTPPPRTGVQLHEVLASSPDDGLDRPLASAGSPEAAGNGRTGDWVELHNSGPVPVGLEGWSLADLGSAPPFTFPANTSLGPGDYLVVWCDRRTNSAGLHTGFALDGDRESVFLYDAQGQRVDAVSLGGQIPGYSVGRSAEGSWQLTEPTPGGANLPATLAPSDQLVINEWLANPLPGQDDWIELHNRATAPIALHGLYLATEDAIDRVRDLAFVAPGGFVRLWADEQPGAGHLGFRLSAAGGGLTLLDALGAPLDGVVYGPQLEDKSMGRWPDGAANLVVLDALTPGHPNATDPALSDHDGDGLPDVWELDHDLRPDLASGRDGPRGDPDGDGLTNWQEYLAGTDPQDPTSRLQFSAVVLEPDGLHLGFSAVAGRTYSIQYAESLASPRWQKLENLSAGAVNRWVEVVDRQLPGIGARFYRLVTPALP